VEEGEEHLIAIFKTLTDQLMAWLKDDPVRPGIPVTLRIGKNADIFALQDSDKPQAITCVSYQDFVPKAEWELFTSTSTPTVAVFYTIWSYQKGAGRALILDALAHIRQTRPEITTFVTLSPKTDMAREFHLRNGASVYRENRTTINYHYKD
jgi:hypothetical protein